MHNVYLYRVIDATVIESLDIFRQQNTLVGNNIVIVEELSGRKPMHFDGSGEFLLLLLLFTAPPPMRTDRLWVPKQLSYPLVPRNLLPGNHGDYLALAFSSCQWLCCSFNPFL